MRLLKILTLVFIFTVFATFMIDAYPSVEEVILIEELLPEEYQSQVFYMCVDYDIPVGMLMRLLFTESSFNPNAVAHENNGTKSFGYMQINSGHLDYYNENYYNVDHVFGEFDITNPLHNLIVGMNYLVDLKERFGDWETALLAYNAGCGNVSRGNIPLSSLQYSEFIVTGKVGSDSYLYRRMCEYNAIISDLGLDKLLVCSVE